MKLIILFLIFLSFSTFSNSPTELTCYSTTFAPYSFVKDGIPSGIDIDIINYIAEKIDISVTFELLPWERLKQNMRQGKIECAMAFLKTTEYAENMVFMDNPITTGNYTVFIEKKNSSSIKMFTDLYGLTVGINRGFKSPEIFEQAITKGLVNQYEVGSEQQSLQMLSMSRLDGVLTDQNVGLFNLQQLGISTITTLPEPLTSTPVYLVFSHKWQQNGVVDKFNTILKTMKKEGSYQNIIDKYISDINH